MKSKGGDCNDGGGESGVGSGGGGVLDKGVINDPVRINHLL